MGQLVDAEAEALRQAAVFESATDRMRRELLERQDAWLVEQAAARGWTVEQLAERYTLEYEPIELDGGENSDFIFRATQQIRLKRREPDEH